MNAREMFEELGYSLKVEHNDFIEYSKEDCGHIDFYFLIETKRFYSRYCFSPSFQSTAHSITLDEFEAVQKQMEELGWFEGKKESNLEHYKEEIKSAGYDFALVNGKPTMCKWILCDQCFFKDRILCAKKRIEWMLKPFKRKYKLTQFEYDLLQSYASGYKFKDIMPLIVMKEKGYFKDINKDEKITDILWNCGVIKND